METGWVFKLFIQTMAHIRLTRGMVSRFFRVRIIMSLVMLWTNPRLQYPMLGLTIGMVRMATGLIPM